MGLYSAFSRSSSEVRLSPLSLFLVAMCIAFFDPTVILNKYPQDLILKEEKFGKPPGHYTNFGEVQLGELYKEKIRRIVG